MKAKPRVKGGRGNEEIYRTNLEFDRTIQSLDDLRSRFPQLMIQYDAETDTPGICHVWYKSNYANIGRNGKVQVHYGNEFDIQEFLDFLKYHVVYRNREEHTWVLEKQNLGKRTVKDAMVVLHALAMGESNIAEGIIRHYSSRKLPIPAGFVGMHRLLREEIANMDPHTGLPRKYVDIYGRHKTSRCIICNPRDK